ncbi:DUF6285 domain-containing protein [Marinibaculum pumilum]|uniref:DUF6285 domain-containing protein n=1 Tax=Marinibaculum pumilum TaxID=1766165 RepID=A0ABV7L769_9PROT
MPDSRPEAADLVAVVRDWLKEQVLPDLQGEPQFQCRVAMSLLAMVQRELQTKPQADSEERARLHALTGAGAEEDLVALNRILCARIDAGEIAVDDPRLLDHLGRTLREALAINNPRWLPAAERPE